MMKVKKAAHQMKKRRLMMIHHATILHSFVRNQIYKSYEKLRLDWHIKRNLYFFSSYLDKILVFSYESMDQSEISHFDDA
jgi:hypothetical protein